jgi:hypothetical protein
VEGTTNPSNSCSAPAATTLEPVANAIRKRKARWDPGTLAAEFWVNSLISLYQPSSMSHKTEPRAALGIQPTTSLSSGNKFLRIQIRYPSLPSATVAMDRPVSTSQHWAHGTYSFVFILTCSNHRPHRFNALEEGQPTSGTE